MTDDMKIHRNDLLTRRIRRVLRVFANGPRSYNHSALPNIVWDEEIIPKDLYPEEDLIAAREERDIAAEEEKMKEKLRKEQEERRAKSKIAQAAEKKRAATERLREIEEIAQKRQAETKRKEEEAEEEKKQKEEEEQQSRKEEDERRKEGERRKEEQVKAKDAAEAVPGNTAEIGELGSGAEEADQQAEISDGKGKGREVDTEGQAPQVRPTKRSRKAFKSREFIEDSDEIREDDPSTLQVSKKPRTSSVPIASEGLPPCERCRGGNIRCYPNGYRKACLACRTAKQTCSHSKLKSPSSGLRPDKGRRLRTSSRSLHNPPPPPDLSVPPAPYSRQVVLVKRKRDLDDGEAGPSKTLKVRIPASIPVDASSTRKVSPSAKGEILGMFIVFVLYR